MRVLIRGGSIAAGHGVSRSYVDILRDVYPDLEIMNRSRFKDTSFQGVWSFRDDIDAIKPDVLIIHFGIDDAYNPVYRSEFKENLVQMVRLARKRFNPVILLLTSHPFEDQYDMDTVYIYYRVLREVASDLSCELVPVHIYWTGILEENGMPISDLLQSDTRYPNEKGHVLYAEAVITRLNHVLDRLKQ